MVNSKFFLFALAITPVVALSGMIHPAYAIGNQFQVRNEVRETVKENIKETVRDDFRKVTSTPPGFLKRFFGNRAVLGNASLTAKNGTTLTVTKDGKTYTVQTDGNTQLRRRFWGKSSLDEMQIGDMLNITGTWTDDAQTTIKAKLVRDVSIQKRFGVFIGNVTSTSSTGFVMNTVNRGMQTVTVGSTTKYIGRNQQAINFSDIATGHRVRVRGLWDNKSNTITDVSQVKDYNLPPKVTSTPTPTLTPTPTPTP